MDNQEKIEDFAIHLKESLPSCFRVNPLVPNHSIIVGKLQEELAKYNEEYIKRPEELPNLKLQNIEWVS